MSCRARFLVFVAFLMAVPGLVLAQTPPTPSAPPATPAPPAATPAAPPSPPKPVLPPEVTSPVERLARGIEAAEKSIEQIKELEQELARMRGEVETIIYDSTATAEALRPQLADVKSQIEKLGPPPKDGPEAPAIAAERARLNALATALDGAIKSTELAWVRAKHMIDRITVMRFQIFSRNLFERRPSPLLPSVWSGVTERLPGIIGRVKYYGGDWIDNASSKRKVLVPAIVGVLVVALLLNSFINLTISRRRKRFEGIPSFFDRIVSAAGVAPARMLSPMFALVAIYFILDAQSMYFSPWERTATTTLLGFLIYTAGTIIARAALEPKLPQWRLIPLDDATSSYILFFVKALLAVYIVDTVMVEFARAIYVPLSVTVVQTFVTNMTTAFLLAIMLLRPFISQTGPLRAVNHLDRVNVEARRRMAPMWVKLPLWLLVAVIVIASSIGYVAFGRYVAQQIVLTGTVLSVAGLLYLGVRAVTRRRGDKPSAVGTFLEEKFKIDRTRQGQIVKLGEVAALIAIASAVLPVLMLQWGYAGEDIRDWAKALFFGFEIGQFRISIMRILIGIILFIVLLFVTRMIQFWLRERVVSEGRMDVGVAQSIDTAIGYTGFGVAALISASYAGFDVTNLAIVAGALSVGIGFGLQSIVNNFVSGLILLVERPVKVGDWIVVGDQQGHVRRISVRSTEIETFDRASLIVPNSELISGRVLNWTHRNMLGRIILKVTTDIKANPKQVITLLEQAAHAQPLVQTKPPPVAVLEGFGPGQIDFTLNVTLTDVNTSMRVKSDLHVSVLEALRQAGIYATLH